MGTKYPGFFLLFALQSPTDRMNRKPREKEPKKCSCRGHSYIVKQSRERKGMHLSFNSPRMTYLSSSFCLPLISCPSLPSLFISQSQRDQSAKSCGSLSRRLTGSRSLEEEKNRVRGGNHFALGLCDLNHHQTFFTLQGF